jgi:hypothetical protein
MGERLSPLVGPEKARLSATAIGDGIVSGSPLKSNAGRGPGVVSPVFAAVHVQLQ